MFNFDLSQDILTYLQQTPFTKEVEIIRHLQAINRIPIDALQDDLTLFRTHFLVFNSLYRLQKYGIEQRQFKLTVSALFVELDEQYAFNQDVEFTTRHMQANDPLAAFYLDLSHLLQTESHDVTQLLNQFWQKFISPQSVSDDEKQSALAELELCDPVDFTTIKQQYRRLAMQHHPDRGGDQDKLVAINQAMQCLEDYYRR